MGALTYYLFHHRELNMWVIAEGEGALTSLGSEKIVVQSGVSGSSVIPSTGYEQWTWEKILPYCMDMDSDNFCKYEGYKPDEAFRSLMHKSYPFSEGEDEDGRQVTAAAPAIYAHMGIPASSGLANGKESGSATSWELRMDIRVTHSTNGTYFMTVGWYPGGYSGIQQTPDTKHVPSGKNFLFSMWDTNTDNHGNGDGGTPSYSYVDELNDKADIGGQVGVINTKFGGEGTGQKIQIDYPWAIGDTTTAFIRGSRASLDSDEWCVASGLAPPGKEEVFLARFCRRSPEGVLNQSGFHVFIEDWMGPTCPATGNEVGFMKQRAAVFSNWKVTVDGKEVDTAAPRFVTVNGHARGLTDAGMLGDKAFYISVGGWKYNNPYNP